MSLPEGTYAGVAAVPLQEERLEGSHPFTGRVEVLTGNGSGFFIVEEGKVTAAYFKDETSIYRGRNVITHLMHSAEDTDLNLRYIQYRYNPSQMEEAGAFCQQEGLFMQEKESSSSAAAGSGLDDALLNRLFCQQGVVAISVFFEGFPVQSIGESDFEQVAAMAEDFLRAGKKMADNLRMGVLDQIILESNQRKCIIAPYGDLYLCLLTDTDVNLGLIRLAIHNIQGELKGRD